MMATRLTFPLICSNKDQFDISQNYFNGLNKFKKKKDAPKKFISRKSRTKKMHGWRSHRCSFFSKYQKKHLSL